MCQTALRVIRVNGRRKDVARTNRRWRQCTLALYGARSAKQFKGLIFQIGLKIANDDHVTVVLLFRLLYTRRQFSLNY